MDSRPASDDITAPPKPTDTLRVAIMHDSMHTFGGAERVTRVICDLFPKAPLFTPIFNENLRKYFPQTQIVTSSLQRRSFLPAKFLFLFLPGAVESFDFSEFDVVISSSNSYAKNIITKPQTKHISYIHAPMRYAWDAAHDYAPVKRLFAPARLFVASLLHKIRLWDQYGASRVDVYLANSNYTAQRIAKYYRKPATVLYPPVDTDRITAQDKSGDYFLIISRLSEYKRVDIAIEACNHLKLPLYVLGEGEEADSLKQIAGPTVKLMGWVSDEDKYQYLRNCKALIFPGEEDFGIVPVEAMAAGKPVIAFKKGGLEETVIDGKTGIFFEDQSTESLATALNKFLAGESKFDWRMIRQHAEQFSPTTFKSKLMDIVNGTVKDSARE